MSTWLSVFRGRNGALCSHSINLHARSEAVEEKMVLREAEHPRDGLGMDEKNAPSGSDLGSSRVHLDAADIKRWRGINADWQASLKLLPEVVD